MSSCFWKKEAIQPRVSTHIETLPRAASQALLTFQFSGEQWLETGPSDTSLNRKEVRESFQPHLSVINPAGVYK